MKILVEKDRIEKIEVGDIVQTEKGIFMKIYAGYLSLESDSLGMIYYDYDFENFKLLIKSEDVVISKAKKDKEEIYEVEKVEEVEDNNVVKYKDELYLSEDFIKFLGKVSYNNVKEIFKVDDSLIKDSLDDLLFSIYDIYYNHRDKVDDEEFIANELKNMIYDFFDPNNEKARRFDPNNEKAKRTDETLLGCINCFKNIKKENLLNVYCNISMMQYFGSLDEITYYFNKIGKLIRVGRIGYLNEN